MMWERGNLKGEVVEGKGGHSPKSKKVTAAEKKESTVGDTAEPNVYEVQAGGEQSKDSA